MTNIFVPKQYREILASSSDYIGFMGLSVGKQDFMRKETMHEYGAFMQENFPFSFFVIADYPKKYNLMALEGFSERKAEERTRVAGDDLRNMLEKVTRNYPRVKVTRWGHFMNEDYLHNLGIVKNAYVQNPEFKDEVDSFAQEFLTLPTNIAKLKGDGKNQIAIAKEYVLDELAFLVAFPVNFSIPVCEIYPGRHELHEKLQEKSFSFCNDLRLKENRVFMGVYCGSGNS